MGDFVDVSAVTQIITTLGFPIAVCCILFWYVYKMQQTHKEEIAALTQAIENNTIVLTKLEAKLEEKEST